MKQNNNTDWQNIYNNYSPKLLGICRRYIPDIQTAEDILQDSFMAAIQNNHQLRDEKALFGWLKKIVVNNALQYLRKESKDLFVSIEPSEIPDNFSEMNHSASQEKNIFIYDFTREQLLSSIDSLPSHHKSVFNLYFIDNHSHAEISEILGITVNTSKSHLLRAKKSIQSFLLNNFVNENTPKNKKKMAQLLVIFGFGGLLWAQTFQAAFSNFKILPSKTFKIPANNQTYFFQSFSGNHAWKKKIIIGSAAVVIVAASIVAMNINSTIFNKNHSDNVKISDSTNQNNIKNYDETIEKSQDIDSDIAQDNTEDNSQKDNVSENAEEKLALKNQSKTNNTITRKDSAKEEPQKVIIVKKIIKRDTIFVER